MCLWWLVLATDHFLIFALEQPLINEYPQLHHTTSPSRGSQPAEAFEVSFAACNCVYMCVALICQLIHSFIHSLKLKATFKAILTHQRASANFCSTDDEDAQSSWLYPCGELITSQLIQLQLL